MEESGINFTKLLCSRKFKKRAEIVVKRSRMWPSSDDIIGCSRLQQEHSIKDERTRCREDLKAIKMRIQVASVKLQS